MKNIHSPKRLKFAAGVAITSISLQFLLRLIPYLEYFEIPQQFGIVYSDEAAYYLLTISWILEMATIFGLMFFFIRFYQHFFDKD